MKEKIEKPLELSDISVFHFKQCGKGDLSFFDGDASKWDVINGKWEEATSAKGSDLPLELRKQIAMKDNDVKRLNLLLFIMETAFSAYDNSYKDKYYLDLIGYCADELIKHGIKFNKRNNVLKEYNRCIKLVRNKLNDIQVDINDLAKVTKGGITFETLVAILGKWSGVGMVNQKQTTMDEFIESYNLMANG
jgi:hypothetical protein